MDPSLFPTWHEFSLPDLYNDDLKAIQNCNVVHKWMSLLAEAPIKILFTRGKCMTDFCFYSGYDLAISALCLSMSIVLLGLGFEQQISKG